MGIFAEGQNAYETANKAFAMRSTADSIIFNRDTDGMDAFEDPRDFEGAAGNRSETAAMSVRVRVLLPELTVSSAGEELAGMGSS